MSEVTHIEIRRVQNGFVVMGFNFSTDHTALRQMPPNIVAMVAGTPQELGALVESIAIGAEMKWLPSVDIPIIDMRRRVEGP